MNRDEQIEQYCIEQGCPAGTSASQLSAQHRTIVDAIKWADEHSCLKLWHTMDEEPPFLGVVLMDKEMNLYNASYCGGGRFQLSDYRLPNRLFHKTDFCLWALRKDLFDKTNFKELWDKMEKE